MGLVNTLIKGDRIVWAIFIALCVVSVLEVFSASTLLAYRAANYWSPIFRHLQMLGAGVAIVLLAQNIPYRFFSLGILLLPLSAVLLAFTLYYGEDINGSSRWMNMFGVSFQPSEIAKLACVIYVSFLLSRRQKFTDAQIFKYILFGVFPICGLIVLENFSTAIMLYVVCVVIMYIGQIAFKKLIILILVSAIAVAAFIGSLFIVKDEWVTKYDIVAKIKHRVETFTKPKEQLSANTYIIDDDNRQETYAKIAIANGGIGKFPGLGQQRDHLPAAFSDFIYAIIIEEMGIIGGVVVMFLYIFLLFRAGTIARRCEKLFPKLLVLACGLMIGIQAFANMAVVVGLFPVTGQPLPLISRGGTSTIITCTYIGIILSVSRFGAGIGDEEDEDGDEDDEPSPATAPEAAPGNNPLEAVQTLNNLEPC
jgi:cell division protein FtsW